MRGRVKTLGLNKFVPVWFAILLAFPAVLPLALAQETDTADGDLEWYVEPRNEKAGDIKSLFNLTSYIALGVFVLVEGLLLVTIIRWRKNKTVPQEEEHRGHTTAEIILTIIPALILLGLGVVSAQALVVMDEVPEDVDYTLHVEASQFIFQVEYPTGNKTFSEFIVEEGTDVGLTITGKDVIHALWIPSFGIKIDANPGRLNTQWFDVPMLSELDGDTYHVQCAEYCGNGHHGMVATVKVVPQGSRPDLFG